jgi:hypothetical protein
MKPATHPDVLIPMREIGTVSIIAAKVEPDLRAGFASGQRASIT